MKPGQNSVERIRRHEVSRALKKVNLSSEEEEVIDLFSRSLVGRLLHGPISEVMERAEAELSFRGRPGQEAPRGLE
jgi:glutamyl-tRNA reductase